MATIKTFIGITDYNLLNNDIKEDSTGAVLTSYSGPPTGILIDPLLKTKQDLTIKYGSVLFSFPLSREFTELAQFSDPKIYLVIQGRTLSNESKIIKIYNGNAPDSSLICVWQKYYGIIRARVPISKIKEFNYITYVGIVMTRSDGVKDATGRIYKIGNLKDELHEDFRNSLTNNNAINPLNISDIVQISQSSFLSGAAENPVTKTQQITHGIAIAPNTYTSMKMFNVYGINNKNNGVRNSRFFNNAIYYQFPTIYLNGAYRRPDYVKIDDWKEYISTPESVSIDIDASIDEYSPNIRFQHGGYEYSQNIENYPPQKLKRDNLFLTFTNDEEMSEFFDFEGQRYRTKFKSYSDDKHSLILDTNVINGTLQQHSLTYSPYQLTSDQKQINIKILKDKPDEFIILTDKTSYTELKKTYSIKRNLYNIFTQMEEEVNIQIPLVDEYEYYFLGDLLSIRYPNNNIKNQSLKNREIVVYSDSVLIDQFSDKNSKVFDLSTFNFNNNIVKSWHYHKSYLPLKDNEFNFVDTDNTVFNKSYFEYRKPVIKKTIGRQSVDITNKVYSYNLWKPWTILYSRSFPKPPQEDSNIPENTNIITDLRIQEGKLYYKINTDGLGDKNDKFSINQFINYAIDKRHPIGLSSFDKNKVLKIFIPTELIPDYVSENEWYDVKTIGTNEDEDSVDTLKLFYTDMNNVIDAPDVSSLKLQDAQLKLRLQYSDTAEDYVIFDFVVGSAQIIAGSRPLGLRKHGIIVNPANANEELSPSTAEKIHVTLEGTDTTGKVIEMVAHDKVGTILDTCNIEYKTDESGETKGFYFNGVNLSELKNTVNNSETGLVTKVGDLETTVGDSSSGLVKDVNDNKTDIANLKGLQIFTITKNKIGKSSDQQYKEGDAYTQSVDIADTRIKSTSICIPIASIDAANSDGDARKTATCQAYSATPSDGKCNVGYITGAYDYGGGKWYVQIMLIVINLPSNVTSSINLETTSIDGTEENIELNTDENEILETIDEENLTTP